jgi:hypothetical protein
VGELWVEGVTSREVADGPGLRVVFTLGEERLYDLRALGFDGVVRFLIGALKVDFSVRLPLASGLADALAPRLDLVEPVRLGDAASASLLRGRLLLPPVRLSLRPSGLASIPGVNLPVILLRLATEVPFPYCFNIFWSASGLSAEESSGVGFLVTGVRPPGFSPGVSGSVGTCGRYTAMVFPLASICPTRAMLSISRSSSRMRIFCTGSRVFSAITAGGMPALMIVVLFSVT